jgi:beta-glucosidase
MNWTVDARGWLRGGEDFTVLTNSVEQGLISEPQIDTAVSRELTARFRLGLFDPPSLVPWSKIGLDQNDTPEHRALALKVARESIVLLKNNGLLPLDRSKLKRIVVIGPNAKSVAVLRGNYSGTPSHPITILDGIKQAAGANVTVTYVAGCPLVLKTDNSNKPTPEMTARAIAAAKAADVVIYVGGIDASLEREEANAPKAAFQGFYRGDRTRIELPAVQSDLLKALHATGKPVVFVNCSGSAMAMPWEAKHLKAIVQAWYPGEEGGCAVAEVLFGEVNPAGRLPVTFYRSTADLPPFEDYAMADRTYRYLRRKPLFAFGHGLSYTKFYYGHAHLEATKLQADDRVSLSFALQNRGARAGDEVAQVYVRHVHSALPQANLSLCAFTRIHLAPGQTTKVTLRIPTKRFHYWDTTQKHYVVEPGKYELLIGGASDEIHLRVRFKIAAAQ